MELEEKGVWERQVRRIGGAQSKSVAGLQDLDLCPSVSGGGPHDEFDTLRAVRELNARGVLDTLSAETRYT